MISPIIVLLICVWWEALNIAMNETKWIKQLVQLLIVKYKEHEHLYNIRHPKYLDRTCRAKTFLKICEELQEVCEDMTVDDIKRKIKTLRSQYVREWREINKNGADAEEVIEPKLWCFNQLEFLRPYLAPRIPISSDMNELKNYNVEREDTLKLNNGSNVESPLNGTDISNPPSCDMFEKVECNNYFPSENARKRPKREKLKYEKNLNRTIIEKDNEFVAFATSISYQLEKLPEADAYMLMAEIQNLITDRKIKNLRATYSNDST